MCNDKYIIITYYLLLIITWFVFYIVNYIVQRYLRHCECSVYTFHGPVSRTCLSKNTVFRTIKEWVKSEEAPGLVRRGLIDPDSPWWVRTTVQLSNEDCRRINKYFVSYFLPLCMVYCVRTLELYRSQHLMISSQSTPVFFFLSSYQKFMASRPPRISLWMFSIYLFWTTKRCGCPHSSWWTRIYRIAPD